MMRYMKKASKKRFKATVIILTRNEINGVRRIVPQLPQSPQWEYLAVDYQSSDGTNAFFASHNIPVIAQQSPGHDEAFLLGASHTNADILVLFSPDGNEDPKNIPTLIQCIQNGADLAIASRFTQGARNEEDDQLLKFRAWANRLFTWVVNIIWRGHVTDALNGYRAITRQALSSLSVDAKGHCIEYQMTIRALKRNMKIVEIPTCEGRRIGGHTTASTIPTGLRILWYLAREILIGNRF